MTKYKKLQIIKHALQCYIRREGASEKDIDSEKQLLSEVEAEERNLIAQLGLWVMETKIMDPLLIEWDMKKTELRKIVATPCADWIINAIKPEANQYPLAVAIGRITVFIQLALKGIDESKLLNAAQNYQEHLLLAERYLSSPLSEIHLEG